MSCKPGLQACSSTGLVWAQHPPKARDVRYARWMQWTQIIGPNWGMRSAYTIRAFPTEQYAMVLKWSPSPASALSLTSVPDPGGLMALRMFRTYEERPITDLASSVDLLEDFCWLERSRLFEKVWTETTKDAAEFWEGFTTASNATPLALPATGTLLWIQPTMDLPDHTRSNSLILEGTLAGHPLATLLNRMVDDDLFVAATTQNTAKVLEGTGIQQSSTSILVRLANRPDLPYPCVYLRLLSTGSTQNS